MTRFYYILLSLTFATWMFSSCEVINPKEEIPSYIRIDHFNLSTDLETQGSNSHKITDAWVYVDDQLIGAFELPATIPILAEGQHKVDIRPGIKVNGISSTRAIYPFYKPYVVSMTLIADSIIPVTPAITYYPTTVFEWKEDFEEGGVSLEKATYSDTTIEKTSDITKVFGGTGYSGIVKLDAAHEYFECSTISSYDLPQGDNPVFLEMNFKSTENILVGLYSYSTYNQKMEVMYLNKTDDWNKIYINLKSTINRVVNPIHFKVFFAAEKSETNEEAEILIDNIKLLHN